MVDQYNQLLKFDNKFSSYLKYIRAKCASLVVQVSVCVFCLKSYNSRQGF